MSAAQHPMHPTDGLRVEIRCARRAAAAPRQAAAARQPRRPLQGLKERHQMAAVVAPIETPARSEATAQSLCLPLSPSRTCLYFAMHRSCPPLPAAVESWRLRLRLRLRVRLQLLLLLLRLLRRRPRRRLGRPAGLMTALGLRLRHSPRLLERRAAARARRAAARARRAAAASRPRRGAARRLAIGDAVAMEPAKLALAIPRRRPTVAAVCVGAAVLFRDLHRPSRSHSQRRRCCAYGAGGFTGRGLPHGLLAVVDELGCRLRRVAVEGSYGGHPCRGLRVAALLQRGVVSARRTLVAAVGGGRARALRRRPQQPARADSS
eukprot:960157-Pleurochrysis_carterae.AAC.1